MLAQVLIRASTTRWPGVHHHGPGQGALTLHDPHQHAFERGLPALTILGLLVGATVTGAIVVETVFSRNGVGRLAQQSVLAQDIPVVQAIVVLAAAVFVVVNLVVDLIYPLLDPRILQPTSSRSLAPVEVAA